MSRKNFSRAHGRLVQPGQLWIRPYSKEPWRVMAVAEGYAMGRFKGCIVGTIAVKDMADWRLAEPGGGKQ